MASLDADVRDRRGDWKPPSTIKSPPLFALPYQPLAVLKWIFAWPGYLLPWNLLYAGIAILTWAFLTPSLASMQNFELWWIAAIHHSSNDCIDARLGVRNAHVRIAIPA